MSEPYEFTVEPSHVMLFARAVLDENPAYRDAAARRAVAAGGLLAPPTFTEVWQQFEPGYPYRPSPKLKWFGSAATAGGPAPVTNDQAGGGTTFHAEQHFEYHRPVRVGDVLRVFSHPGARWTKQGRRGGTLEFSEKIVEFRDRRGDLVVTSRSVAVTAARAVEDVDT
jgi:acyl dehydratase